MQRYWQYPHRFCLVKWGHQVGVVLQYQQVSSHDKGLAIRGKGLIASGLQKTLALFTKWAPRVITQRGRKYSF